MWLNITCDAGILIKKAPSWIQNRKNLGRDKIGILGSRSEAYGTRRYKIWAHELCTCIRLNSKKTGIEWYRGTKNRVRNQSPLLTR